MEKSSTTNGKFVHLSTENECLCELHEHCEQVVTKLVYNDVNKIEHKVIKISPQDIHKVIPNQMCINCPLAQSEISLLT